jgi:hypothetical protein
MYRRLTLVAIAAVAVVGLASPAHADGTGDAYNDEDEIGAEADSSSELVGVGGSGGGDKPLCRYVPLDDAGNERATEMATESEWEEQPGPGPGRWYQRVCDLNGRFAPEVTIVWLPDPVVDPAELAQQAKDRAPIPAPEVRLNPPAGEEQVVNVPTWMWLDRSAWAPVTATASAGAVTVTATASPSSVRWDMGNGDVVVCDGPGTPYDRARPAREQESDCSYTYRRSSAGRPGGAYRLTVTTTWTVSWTVSGAPGGGSLGTASRTTTTDLRVAEIQAVNE